jgi:glycosyltransferase involved in cell wall biosynthesis
MKMLLILENNTDMKKSDSSKYNLSVIMANFNHAEFLENRIKSFFNQTLPPAEVIVVDDCSTDDSLMILDALTKKYINLIVLTNPKNIGPVESIRIAQSKSTSEVIYPCSCDDFIINNNFFMDVMDVFNQNIDVKIVMSRPAYSFDDDPDNHQNFKHDVPLINDGFYSDNDYINLQRKKYFHIWGHSSVYLKKAIDSFGGFSPKHKLYCDWYISHMIALNDGFYYINKTYSSFRLSNKSYSSNSSLSTRINALLNIGISVSKFDKILISKVKKSNLFEHFTYLNILVMLKYLVIPKYFTFRLIFLSLIIFLYTLFKILVKRCLFVSKKKQRE